MIYLVQYFMVCFSQTLQVETFPNQYGVCECTNTECRDVFQLCGASNFTFRENFFDSATSATTNGPSRVPSLNFTVYSFNGLNSLANNWLTIPDSLKSTFLRTTDQFSLSFWLRVESDSDASYIASFELGNNRYFSLYESSTARMTVYYFRDALPNIAVVNDDGYDTQVALSFYYDRTHLPNGLRDNLWHFLSLTVSYPSMTLLIDGVEYQPTRGNYRSQFDTRILLNQVSGVNYSMPAPILTKTDAQINSIVARIGGSIRGTRFTLFGEMRQLVLSSVVNNNLYACLASCNNMIGVDPRRSFSNFITFYNPVTRVFDFTGRTDAAGYTEFLQSLVYFSNGFLQPEESGERRVISLRINDERGLGNVAIINLIGRSNQNDPLLDANGDLVAGINFSVDFREDVDGEVGILSPRSFITDTDLDSVIVSVTVNLTNPQNGQAETLRLLDNPPNLVNVTGSNGQALQAGSTSQVIFINSVDPLRATANIFITVLLNLRYSNTANEPTDVDRIIEFTVYDGLRSNNPRAVTTIDILTINDVPILDLNGNLGGLNQQVRYVESSPPIALVRNLLINDPDSFQLVQADARIDRIFDTGNESIAFDMSLFMGTGLTCVPAACNGTVLSIRGIGDQPDYQDILRTLRYVNLQQSTDLPSLRDRTVFINISDGVASSNQDINVVIDFIPANPRVIIELAAPSQNFSTTFTEAQAEPIFCHSLVRAVDTSINTLESIVVSIRDVLPDGVTEDEERISVTRTTGLDISIEINTALKRVTFSQTADISQYLEAVRRIQYSNEEPEPILINRFVDFLVIPGGGAPNDTAVCNITILGVNDNQPECPAINPINVSENSTDGYEIIQLEATDPDRGVDGVLSYQLVEGVSSLFEVTPGGLVRLIGDSLNREVVPEYLLGVEACDSGTPQRCCQFNLTVLIEDVNDNPPVFNSSSYSFNLDENVATDISPVLVISDIDEGSNSELARVEIDPDSFSTRTGCFDRFSVRRGPENTIILSTSGLDFEMASTCDFQVIAYDAGVPSLSGRAAITVTVNNIDDFPPEFSMDSYIFTVEEENTFPLSIGRVQATDRDSSTLEYSQSSLSSLFEVNETSGNVSILFSSNRAEAILYRFEAIVTDPRGSNDTATVLVNVIAINNDPPVLDLNVTDSDSQDALTPFTFTEEGNPVRIVTDPNVTDPDELALTITEIRVSVANSGNPSSEVLSVSTNPDTPPHTTRSNPGQLIIFPQNVASSDDIHSLLQSVLYSNTEDELSECQSSLYPCLRGPLSRTLLFSVFDSRFASNISEAFVEFQVVNDPPLVDLDTSQAGLNFITRFTEGSRGTSIVNTGNYNITDEDSQNLLSLTCNLTNPLDSNREMIVVRGSLPNGLSLAATTSPHVIQIVGNLDIASYMIALGMIEYNNTSNNPDETQRLIEVYVSDDDMLVSNVAITTISFNSTNDPPSLDLDSMSPALDYSTSYVENGNSVSLSRFPIITDVDSTVFQRLEVTIREGSGPEDVLTLNQSLISGPLTFSYTYPRLIVTGTASLGTYQAIVMSVMYENTADEIANITSRIVDFVITDVRGGTNIPVSTIVSITPVDDNDPAFSPSNVYEFSVMEDSPSMVLVGTVTVIDADLPQGPDVLQFNIFAAEPALGFSDFRIRNSPTNSSQGEIIVAGTIDFMRVEVYRLVIMARSSSRTARANITIRVINLPNIPPEFNNCPPTFSVVENERFSAPLFPPSCTAVDPDGLDQIRYTIQGNEFEGSALITIDSITGTLTVVDNIDRETIGVQFSATITASDSTQSTSRNITVIIQGQNEHAPIFERANYIASVEENAEPDGQPLLQVTATDLDEQPDIQENSQFISRITYSIGPPSVLPYFSINSTSGEITQLLPIDFEMFSRFVIVVMANDNDFTSEPRSSDVEVIIQVSNINDEPPRFDNLPDRIVVSELTQVRDTIMRISTSDPDNIVGTLLSVSFVPPAPSQFLLTPGSGILSVREPLDADVAPRVFEVTLQLVDVNTDSRYPEAAMVFANTTIIIEDANDIPPIFDRNEYTGRILENSPSGSIVLNVSATDLDYGLDPDGNPNGNNRLIYSFSARNAPPSNTFDIDRDTGAITKLRVLNREDAAQYVFTVLVQDNPPLGDVTLVHTALVTITIEDINEFPPVPDPDVYFAFIPESIRPGEQILTYARTAWNISCKY